MASLTESSTGGGGADYDNDSVSGDNDASLLTVKLTAKKNFLMRLSSPLEKTKLMLSKTSYENMKHICL